VVGGKKLTWKKGDTFCIPSWYEFVHHANVDEPAYLYNAHDKPMLRSLGFYRTVETGEESLVSS
jgi:gentisate 1,2-dioxygenase